jgi:hypothetical protein
MNRTNALASVLASAVLLACTDSSDSPTGPDFSSSRDSHGRQSVVVCHQATRHSRLLEVSSAALGGHLGHGDYVAQLTVDPTAPTPTDGVRFARITDALDAARAVRIARNERESAACRITIDVASGTYVGSFDAGVAPALERFPLMIDVPDVTLRGALQMDVDRWGRATGLSAEEGVVTTLTPDRPIVFTPITEALILVVGHPGGSRGSGAAVEGFAFRSGHPEGASGGVGILSLRVDRLVIRGNRFEPGLTSGADLRATSARLAFNFGNGLGVNCGLCLAGPGDYVAIGNRLLAGGLGGIYVSAAVQDLPFSLGAAPAAPVEPYVLPASASVGAAILNNEIRDHVRRPIGFAVRILALGPGSSAVQQSGRVFLGGNDFTGNTFGVILDAGFPQANTLLRGDLDVALRGNTISGNCQNNLLVAFTRHTGALGTTTNPYLLNSTFRLSLGGDLPWDGAWYSNPDGNANTLMVDGVIIATGAKVAYDPARACP